MPLVICPDCGKQMSDAAPSCPNCGRPNPGGMAPSPFGGATPAPPAPERRGPWAEPPRENRSNKGLILAAAAFFGILAVIAFGLRKNSPADDPSPNAAPTAAPAAVAAPGAIEDPKLVTATDGQSRMTVPGSWREMPDLNDEAEIELGNLAGEQYAIVLTENRADFDEEVDLARFTEVVSQNIRNNLVGGTVSESRALTVDGLPALQRTLRGSVDGLRIAYWLTTIQGERNYYQIVMWTLASRADDNEPVFQAVVASFQEILR